MIPIYINKEDNGDGQTYSQSVQMKSFVCLAPCGFFFDYINCSSSHQISNAHTYNAASVER